MMFFKIVFRYFVYMSWRPNMTKLFTDEDFKKAKYNQLLPLQCKNCNRTFYLAKRRIQGGIKAKTKSTCDFCCIICGIRYLKPKNEVPCKTCGKMVHRSKAFTKRAKNTFCSKRCCGTYTASHKTNGTKVSKLEKWIANKLTSLYPNLDFHFNRTDTIRQELDICIPSIKLAFELNGIFHYEPIFGGKRLKRTQDVEKMKFQNCIEKGIELCIIDTSKQKYFKENTSFVYLEIIKKIIDQKIERLQEEKKELKYCQLELF